MMITHDLGVIAEMAQKVVVMYAGKVVEEAPAVTDFLEIPHPYTQGLLKSIPKLRERADRPPATAGDNGYRPSLYDLPRGCRF